MEFTIKLENNRYLDLVLLPSKRMLIIKSPIPDFTISDIEDLVAAFGYKIVLPITGDVYSFKVQEDKEEQYNKELEEAFTFNARDAIANILGAANIIISGTEEYEI